MRSIYSAVTLTIKLLLLSETSENHNQWSQEGGLSLIIVIYTWSKSLYSEKEAKYIHVVIPFIRSQMGKKKKKTRLFFVLTNYMGLIINNHIMSLCSQVQKIRHINFSHGSLLSFFSSSIKDGYQTCKISWCHPPFKLETDFLMSKEMGPNQYIQQEY